ncbi:MAG: hypothetical protein HZA53_18485 [Planctomycetes bacterium]|nr:hypothetical protein [Planctomycetota bacterium]
MQSNSSTARPPDKLMTFLGHGNVDAPLWFLGMEEGTHEDRMTLEENLAIRVKHYSQVMDLHRSQELLGWPIAERTRLTHVWYWMAKLTRGLVHGDADWLDTNKARDYVRTALARETDDCFLAELLPLPKKSAQAWPEVYRQWWPTRSEYERAVIPQRIELLRESIARHRPRWIIAFGMEHAWAFERLLAPTNWAVIGKCRTGVLPRSSTRVAITPFFGNGAFGGHDAQQLLKSLREHS